MRTVLASLLFVAATARADAPPPIELAVTGSIDAGVVATSLAAELQRPVSPAGERCQAPCLSVVVADAKVTIIYTTTDGTRQRTVALGDDARQWPVIVTLLAGNLVRDEAADVLALVPQPPVASAPAAPPEVPEPPAPLVELPAITPPPAPPFHVTAVHERWSPFMIGLVPGLSTDLVDLGRSHTISISAVAGVSHHVRGLAISGAIDVAHGEVSGGQISGAVAVAGDLTGVQLAGAAAVADRALGVQVGGAVAITLRDAGAQIGGAVASAGRDARTQIAGGVAVARDANVQIAGGVTVARDANLQIAGGVAVARHVTGLQIAPINIAKRVDGVQIGVINIGGGPDGDSFGLINIVPGGRTDLETSVDTNRVGTVLFRHGSRHWHNVYGIGGQSVSEQAGAPANDVWMYGLGVGPSFQIAHLPTDLEVIAWQVNHGAHHEDDLSLLAQLRLSIGIPLGFVTLVAGGAINTYISTDHSSPFITARTTNPTDTMSTDATVRVWPSVFVGARI